MSLFCRTQRKIFWRKFVTRLFRGTIDFHSREKKYYGSQWCPRTALFPRFFRISSFVFSRTKTFIQVWNYLRVSKWWQNFHFWVNYPFKGIVHPKMTICVFGLLPCVSLCVCVCVSLCVCVCVCVCVGVCVCFFGGGLLYPKWSFPILSFANKSLINDKSFSLDWQRCLCSVPPSNGFEQSRCAGLEEGGEVARGSSEM